MEGEKTEKPTSKRAGEAMGKGQFARSPEIQTVCVLGAGLMTLSSQAHTISQTLSGSMIQILGELGRLTVSTTSVEMYFAVFIGWLGACVFPLLVAVPIAGIIAGGLQSRFHLTTSVIGFNLDRLNPVANAQKFFAPLPSIVRLGISLMKFLVIFAFTYSVIRGLLNHPIFYSATDFSQVVQFMVTTVESICTRVLVGMIFVAGADYAYKFWKNQQDLMMSKEEVKEESRSTEGNPLVKGEIRKRRMAILRQKWTQEVPKADVVITNPTHLAIVLRYDRKTMKAPRIVAKGARLNALRLRELAGEYKIPIVENKPLAQFLFKHCKVGQEIPAAMYTAVAEVLAYVYRVNRFRYYVEGQKVTP